MSVKGQVTFIKVGFIALFFLIVFSLFLAPFVSTSLGVANIGVFNSFESWILQGFNFWIFIAFVIAILFALYYGFAE